MPELNRSVPALIGNSVQAMEVVALSPDGTKVAYGVTGQVHIAKCTESREDIILWDAVLVVELNALRNYPFQDVIVLKELIFVCQLQRSNFFCITLTPLILNLM